MKYHKLMLLKPNNDNVVPSASIPVSPDFEITPARYDDVSSFVDEMAKVLQTYFEKNPKYGDCWRDDKLDIRGLFAEITTKYERLYSLAWAQHEKMTDTDHRAIVREVCRDTLLYYMFMIRRIELEYGTTDEADLDDLRKD